MSHGFFGQTGTYRGHHPREVAMAAKYQIFLTSAERAELDGVVKKGNRPARVTLSALVLLFSDLSPDGGGKKSNAQIGRELNIS